MSAAPGIDYDRLFKLRLVVARFGEMDVARWWNTKGALGRSGGIVYGRGFPRTRSFAQARAVFAVARARSAQVFNPPRCVTLWSLPAEVEEAFEDHWQGWLDDAETWAPVFAAVERINGGDLLEVLGSLEVLDAREIEEARRLKRAPEAPAVPLSGVRAVDDETLGLLAAGFWRSGVGDVAVPYARTEA